MKKLFLSALLIFQVQSAIAFGQWEFKSATDEMTGEKSYYATSPFVKPKNVMDFPYKNVLSWIGVGCKEEKKWMYFAFTKRPNLVGDVTESGYSWTTQRIKIDENLTEVYLEQSWGSKSLSVEDSEYLKNLISTADLINSLPKANELLLELTWHGNGNVYFPYPMTGSADALAQLFSNCK